jgi:MFS family permease
MNTLWHYYISYFFIGIGIAGVGQVSLTALVSNWFKERRGLAVGIMSSGIGIGGLVLAPLVGAFLIPTFGWRASYFALGLLTCGVNIPLVLLVIKTRPSDMGLNPDGKEVIESGHVSGPQDATPDGLTLNKALFSTALWLIAGTFMLSQFSAMGTVQSQVPHLQDIGFPLGTAATALGGTGLVSAFSKISFGWLCDRIKPKYACAIGITLTVGGIFVLMNIKPTSPIIVLWLYVLIFGFGAGHWLPVVSMLVSTTFGMASYGTIFGLVILFLNVGVSFGPLTAGYIYDSTNSYSLAFIIFMTLGILAILAILCVRRPKAEGRE